MTDREDRIRQFAYFLWLEEGCPQGEAERHWQAAEVLFESEPVERKEREGEPPGEPAGKAQTTPAPVQSPAATSQGLRRRAVPAEKGE